MLVSSWKSELFSCERIFSTENDNIFNDASLQTEKFEKIRKRPTILTQVSGVAADNERSKLTKILSAFCLFFKHIKSRVFQMNRRRVATKCQMCSMILDTPLSWSINSASFGAKRKVSNVRKCLKLCKTSLNSDWGLNGFLWHQNLFCRRRRFARAKHRLLPSPPVEIASEKTKFI